MRCVRWSPDGRLLVSCSDDRTVQLHDPVSGTTVHSFADNRAECRAVAWHPSATCVAVAAVDATVRVGGVGRMGVVGGVRYG